MQEKHLHNNPKQGQSQPCPDWTPVKAPTLLLNRLYLNPHTPKHLKSRSRLFSYDLCIGLWCTDSSIASQRYLVNKRTGGGRDIRVLPMAARSFLRSWCHANELLDMVLPCAALLPYGLCPSIFSKRSFWFVDCLARGESVLNVHSDWSSRSQAFFISIGHCVASDSSVRATRALCLAPEVLQDSRTQWTCLLHVVLAGLLGWQSQAEAWGEQSWDAQVPVLTTWPLALSGLVPRRLVVPSCSVPQEQSIGNREHHQWLGLLEHQEFCTATLPREAEVKSHHCALSTGQRCACETP